MEGTGGDGNTTALSYNTLELYSNSEVIIHVYLFNNTRFYVTILEKMLKGDGELLKKFTDFRGDIDGPVTMSNFEEWVLETLDDFMRKAAPAPAPVARKSMTLLEYFSPQTFAFQLVNKDGKLCALERVKDGLCDEQLSGIPSRVRRVGTGEVYFFKAGYRDHGYLRELDVLSQIGRSGKLDPPFRTSRLMGLVVWGDDGDEASLMEFLLEYIEGNTLDERIEAASTATRRKWFRQVQATVARLHELDIVWGDVKPNNVMINPDGDAVVVDFGGGYTPEYIEPELQETQQGDLTGLDHMAGVIGVRHKSSQ